MSSLFVSNFDRADASNEAVMEYLALEYRSKNRRAQFDRRPKSNVELEDQGKGKRSPVVRWNPATGERQLDELIWGLLPRGTKNPTPPLAPSTRAPRL
jgi:hypothetical protein